MDEGVRIPIGMDNSSLAGDVAQAGNIIKNGLAAAGADSGKSFDPVIEEINRLRSELGQTAEEANRFKSEMDASAAASAKAGQEAAESMKHAQEATKEFIGELANVVLAYVSIEGARQLFESSFKKADEIQDTARALATFTGSVERGTEAMKFFEEAQQHTRSTGLELAKLYTEILPLGMSKGWGQLKLQDLTVQLDQLATKAMVSTDAMINGFRRLLAGGGGGAGRNPLLAVLGLDSASVKAILDAGGDLGAELAKRISEKAGDVPDSWESALKKIKDALLINLGEGVMRSFGQGSAAMEEFKKSFEDPAFLESLRNIGEAMGVIVGWMQAIPKAGGGWLEGVKQVAVELGMAIGSSDFGGGDFGGVAAQDRGKQAMIDALNRQLREKGGRDTAAYGPGYGGPLYHDEDVASGASTRLSKETDAQLLAIGKAGKDQADKAADAAAKVAEMIAKASKEATDAELAFHKLFDPEQPVAFLKKIQETEQAAKAMKAAIGEKADAIQAQLLTPGLSAGDRQALNDDIQRLGDLSAATDEASASKIRFDLAAANDKDLLKASEAITKVKDSFSEFSDSILSDVGKGLLPDSAVNDFEQQIGDIAAAFDRAMTDATKPPFLMPDSETMAKILKTYEQMGKDAGKKFNDSAAAASKMFAEAVGKIFQSTENAPGSIKDWAGAMEEVNAKFHDMVDAGIPVNEDDWNKALVDASKKGAEAFAKAVDEFSNNFADVFTATLTDGAAGFADSASKLFLDGVHAGAKGLGTMFASLVSDAFGAPAKQKPGESDQDFKVRQQAATQQQQVILGAVQTAIGAVGQTMQIMQAAKQGQAPNILATTASFALAGSTFGWIGAAVGAVVGAVVGIIGAAKAKAEQVFATYGVKDGKAYVGPAPGMTKQFLNLPEGQYQDMLAQVQKVIETTTNDYVKLLGRLGRGVADGVIDEISHLNFSATIDSSKSGIKNFMQDFAFWVENTLSTDLIGNFKEPMQKGFEELGLTAGRFKEIWTRLLAIDPSEAIKSWNDLLDALTAFQQVTAAWSPEQFGITVGILSKAREDMARSFADQLAQADVALVQMGQTMSDMIASSPEQIAAAKEWGDALLQREDAVKQFFQQVAQAIDSVIAGYQSKIRDLTLAGFKKEDGTADVGAQVDYLKKYADTLWGQITRATTPEEVMRLSDELSRTISQIQQVGGSQSAEAAEAYRKWAIDQLTRSQDLVVAQLNKMAHDVAEQNAAFLDAIDGFIEAFKHAADALNDAVGPPGSGTETHEPPVTSPGTGGGGHSRDINVIPNSKYDPDTGMFSGPGGGDYRDYSGSYFNPGNITAPALEQLSAQSSSYQPPVAPAAIEGGGVPSGQVMQEWVENLDTSSESFNGSAQKFLDAMKQQAENAAENAAAAQLFAQAVANFEATVAAGLAGGLDITFNGEDAGTVPIDAGGFDRRIVTRR